MTLKPEQLGDKGQRYEIQFERTDEAAGMTRLLGWHQTLEGAERMAASWKKAPYVADAWVVDREAPGYIKGGHGS